jgi:hypothetical protein
MKLEDYKIHPIAACYPLLSEKERIALGDDIKVQGCSTKSHFLKAKYWTAGIVTPSA